MDNDKTPVTPTPIFRGDLSEIKEILKDLSAKFALPSNQSQAQAPLTVEFMIRLMTEIESMALEISWRMVDSKSSAQAQIDQWFFVAERVAKYIKYRMKMQAD